MCDLMKQERLDLIEHGATWISSVAVASGHLEPQRTLDRCLVRSTTEYTSMATTDFSHRPADHAILNVKMCFPNIDRAIGRPHHKNLLEIDQQWYEARKNLQNNHARADDAICQLSEFWKAKRIFEAEQREQLRIIDENGSELPNDIAVQKIKDIIEDLWGKSSYEITKLLTTQKSLPPTKVEIMQAIQNLKKDAAVGRDGIRAENLKDNSNVIDIYEKLLQQIWTTQELPGKT